MSRAKTGLVFCILSALFLILTGVGVRREFVVVAGLSRNLRQGFISAMLGAASFYILCAGLCVLYLYTRPHRSLNDEILATNGKDLARRVKQQLLDQHGLREPLLTKGSLVEAVRQSTIKQGKK
ncbi:putative transmembrane protein [Gregarina niphandrodes]|uniref:Transmembrane protein n=1 Tax=Gregarina niphandrodes TaxID=110365 RepID=A0A023BB99_GRENI|nr:putative transmembrane protein [Gregarina niphandrodes]EZG78875.1 putative transmembrane protein [Gregarina niphandrodes]|eukprot:XP_011129165.1 putative transmembrane protein [Gregarina niphandrodes]